MASGENFRIELSILTSGNDAAVDAQLRLDVLTDLSTAMSQDVQSIATGVSSLTHDFRAIKLEQDGEIANAPVALSR
jgi:hypothetical protein